MLWVNPTSLQVSHQLEETLEALQDAVAQGEQLAVTNSRLSTGSGGGGEGTAGGGQGAGGASMGLGVPGWGRGCRNGEAEEGMGAALFPSRKKSVLC